MGEYSQHDFFQMRKWYGKWALRYSILYLFLGAFLFPATKFGFAPPILIMMLLAAVISHLHLWPALKATHVLKGDNRREKFEVWVVLFLWVAMFLMIFLIDQSTAFLGSSITFFILLGPPLFMFEAYSLRLAKGERN